MEKILYFKQINSNSIWIVYSYRAKSAFQQQTNASLQYISESPEKKKKIQTMHSSYQIKKQLNSSLDLRGNRMNGHNDPSEMNIQFIHTFISAIKIKPSTISFKLI